MSLAVLRGDARSLPLPDACVDLIVTSPPYFGLRSYTDTCRICLDIKSNGLDPASVIVDYEKHTRTHHHYEGQIGSEATPQEWLAALVECTAEWMRVLKPSGSIFVNLGDSFATRGASVRGGGRAGLNDDDLSRGRRPFRQRIGQDMTREEAAWLAGVIDSDGSVSIRLNKQPEGRAPSFVAWVRVGQMRPEVVQRIGEITGTGQVMKDGRGVWNWCAAAQQARWVLARIYPWLLIKRRQAAAAIEVARHVEERNARSSYRPLTSEDIAYRQRLRDAALAWNRGRDNGLTPPEPAAVPLPIYPHAPGEKSLHSLPWQYALECVGRLGLILRRDIIWSKPNGLPESVTDRCRSSHEYVFHLVKQPRYYAAVDEIREAQTGPAFTGRAGIGTSRRSHAVDSGVKGSMTEHRDYNPLGKLPGSVWDIPSQPLTVPARLGIDHFAAFPMELPRRIILGWSPPGVCTACGEGRRPVVARDDVRPANGWPPGFGASTRRINGVPGASRPSFAGTITGYACACPAPTAPTRPALVLDPFGGTGTTALVAAMHGRHGITADMSADYCRLARWRTRDPAERAKAMGVPKPPPVPDGMEPLFATP